MPYRSRAADSASAGSTAGGSLDNAISPSIIILPRQRHGARAPLQILFEWTRDGGHRHRTYGYQFRAVRRTLTIAFF
jgi:hypothetical protein